MTTLILLAAMLAAAVILLLDPTRATAIGVAIALLICVVVAGLFWFLGRASRREQAKAKR